MFYVLNIQIIPQSIHFEDQVPNTSDNLSPYSLYLKDSPNKILITVKTHATNSILRPSRYYGYFLLVKICCYNFNMNSTQ